MGINRSGSWPTIKKGKRGGRRRRKWLRGSAFVHDLYSGPGLKKTMGLADLLVRLFTNKVIACRPLS